MDASLGRRRAASGGLGQTLEDLEGAIHYNRWIAGMMDPYLGKRVLELGCGTGNITEYLAEKTAGRGRVLGVDVHGTFLARARKRLRGRPNVRFARHDLRRGFSAFRVFQPDTLVCVNVLEHVREDAPVLADAFRILPPGGHLLVFVPALPFLYGSMDEQYGHYRRYWKAELMRKFQVAGFHIGACRYLNLLGVLGWWWNGMVLKRRVLSRGQMMLYDRVVAVTGRFERFLPRPIGLSLFCAGVKP